MARRILLRERRAAGARPPPRTDSPYVGGGYLYGRATRARRARGRGDAGHHRGPGARYDADDAPPRHDATSYPAPPGPRRGEERRPPPPAPPRASRPRYPRVEKYPAGTVVELNSADTTILKRVPGIGSAFARRIVNFRAALGGFHSVEQLSEVYGIDAQRYRALRPWFAVDTAAIRPLAVNRLTARQLARHPYVSYPQARVIERLARRRGGLRSWEELSLLEEFTPADRHRLRPYLSFEGD